MSINQLVLFVDSTMYNTLGLFFVTYGVLVSIRFLSYPDLTPDGSFTIAACLFARLVDEGLPEYQALLASLAAGVSCGFTTVFLNEKVRIGKLLSSVIVMIIAVASAPYILGRATIGLLDKQLMLNQLEAIDRKLSNLLFGSSIEGISHPVSIGLGLVTAGVLAVCLALLSKTRWGVAVRYLGSSLNSAPVVGQSTAKYKFAGVLLGNGLVAVGGVIEATRRASADQGMGLGIVLTGVAALIIGESFVRWFRGVIVLSPSQEMVSVVIGVIGYSLIVQSVLFFGSTTIDVRLLSAILLTVILGISHRFVGRTSDLF